MNGLLGLIRIFLRIEKKLNQVVDVLTMLASFQKEQRSLVTVRDEVWLDNQDVMQLLKISPSTLKRRRLEGIIPCTRIKGKCYYKESDIQAMMRRNS